ncbi:MAG: DNA mismatch repair endonuclease MutL [Muribaculaceae bacterium]|nr:DNA mismatch repair endonuclease MutL [Muribaculaceae bacterium]
MSDVIKLLPDSVANQIAAGEVIQRPASVVKELVENAVDAGADTISVVIKDAGRTLIQVVDNGCGMSTTDARLAFERHSTSKITVASDLFALNTMGFRGEALASIAAVAQVELKTMRHGESIGTRLVISGSKVETQEPVATTPGSNMMVKNLFFNVPARRKFLKKDSVELNNIVHEFERLALVNPSLNLTLIHNDNTLHQLLKGSLKQRIGALFGKSIERQLLPISTETSLVKINGFVSMPENARKRGALQYFFVNGRNMRHPYFHKAVMHCYEQLIRADEQPNYFINLEVDPSTIDVNIHPTKNEIKFENEQPIWQILVAAIRESLGRFNAVPAIDFDAPDAPDLPAFNPSAGNFSSFSTSTNPEAYNPFAESTPTRQPSSNNWRKESNKAIGDWQQLYEQFKNATEQNPVSPDEIMSTDIPSRTNNTQCESLDFASSEIASKTSVLQLKNKYILSQNKNGLLIVDQHRAHVRVLYEKYIAINRAERQPSQKVMFPEIVNLTPAQNILLHEILEDIENIGFEIAFVGPNTWAINGIPSSELNENSGEVLKSILDDIAAGNDITRERIQEVIALNLARAGAIRGGKQLTDVEMEHLLNQLFSISTPTYTPDGLKVIAELSVEDIEQLF